MKKAIEMYNNLENAKGDDFKALLIGIIAWEKGVDINNEYDLDVMYDIVDRWLSSDYALLHDVFNDNEYDLFNDNEYDLFKEEEKEVLGLF